MTYTSELLQRVLKANRAVLTQTLLSQSHKFGYYQDFTIQQSELLYKLVELGAIDVALAWDVFKALLDELALPGRYHSFSSNKYPPSPLQHTQYVLTSYNFIFISHLACF